MLMEPNRQKSRRMKGFRVPKSQLENRKSLATFHRTLINRNATLLCLVSEIASEFWVRDMGIAIANHENRCDFGALSCVWFKALIPKIRLTRLGMTGLG